MKKLSPTQFRVDRRIMKPLPVVTPEERLRMAKCRKIATAVQAAAYPTISAENARAAIDLFEETYRLEMSR